MRKARRSKTTRRRRGCWGGRCASRGSFDWIANVEKKNEDWVENCAGAFDRGGLREEDRNRAEEGNVEGAGGEARAGEANCTATYGREAGGAGGAVCGIGEL